MPRCRRRTTPSMRRRARSCSTTARSPTRSSSPPPAGARPRPRRRPGPASRTSSRSLDPYDTASPYHDWGPVLFDAAKVAKQLKLPAPLADLRTTTGPSGRAKSVTALTADDRQVTLTGSQLRTLLELRSTWFTPALLSLGPGREDDHLRRRRLADGLRARRRRRVAGSEDRCAGLDAGRRPAARRRRCVRDVLKPQVATQYRLVSGTVRAGLAKIAVAPRVDAQVTAAGARGTIRPALAGAARAAPAAVGHGVVDACDRRHRRRRRLQLRRRCSRRAPTASAAYRATASRPASLLRSRCRETAARAGGRGTRARAACARRSRSTTRSRSPRSSGTSSRTTRGPSGRRRRSCSRSGSR